ncbi:regulatory protein, luxR family [Methylorubrum salsuginis]|uniref:Regulatory protein, luxR family n=1 Tax=Methylorubrum salsuginis TaxID=414703 RepID=A0A1I4JH12_9HYPH|nr:regulatory protein, luxR family [Methylorubrum salsuginis]
MPPSPSVMSGPALADGVRRTEPVRLTDAEWFAQLGEVAASIGSDSFHRKLLHLAGLCIRHDSSWIIRYSRVAPPDVLYTSSVPDEIVAFYDEKGQYLDPFSARWKRNGQPGVVTLSEIAAEGPEAILYTKIFTPTANIADEIGMFFSTVGHCCFGLFLEREKGSFSKADIARAKLIFPALEGYHRSHLGQLFNQLRTGGPGVSEVVTRPTLIRDRHAVEVFSNASWREAVAADGSILPLIAALDGAEGLTTLQGRDYLLKSEPFDRDFPLAPGGRIFTLEAKRDLGTAAPADSVEYRAAAQILQALTPRERDILTLTMKGQATGQIAQGLAISKGTIKNCKLRIYRKAEVTSERDLVKKFSPFFPSA